MKAILYRDSAALLCDVPAPDPGPGEALLEVEACGLCGTDVMKLSTKAAIAVLGHELCGRLVKLGAGVQGLREGDRVVAAHHVPCLDCHYCRRGSQSMCRQFKATNVDPGGFSELVKLSASHVRHTVLKIPEKLDAAAASQTEPLACCLRNVKRLGLAAGDTAGIVGLGAIGQLTARLLSRVLGVSVLGLDLDASRAGSLDGLARGFTDSKAFVQAARQATAGRGLDAVILTAGSPKFAAESAAWLRDGGTLNVFASFHPDPVMPLDLNAVYHRELTIVSSYSPSLDDLREALDLIASGRLDVSYADQRSYGLEGFHAAVDDVRARRVTKAVIAPIQSVSR